MPVEEKRNQPLLEVADLGKTYGKQRVLDGVDFTLHAGERVAITGPSGSGKSTLLNCLAGLEEPDTGTIRFMGQDLGSLTEEAVTELRRGTLTSVFQFFHLLPTLDARENVEFPLLLKKTPKAERRAMVDNILMEVDLTHRADALPSDLSGGEMQRLAIARALITEPAMILADEPTGSLDSRNSERILELLSSLTQRHGTALLMVTHDPVASATCDRILQMMDGHLHEKEEPSSRT
ncbi:MAG: ABC transporter ATP-binding protein [Puniceicoccaceae bacterium]